MKETKMGVYMVHSTPNAEKILSFAKDTRLLGDVGSDTQFSPREMMLLSDEDAVMKNVKYSLNTIRGPLEFIHYIFLITNASRAMTHQLVRHRVVSFAQQSLRVSDNVGFYEPPEINKNNVAKAMYEAFMVDSQNIYDSLTNLGIPMQDARGVLPLSATSAILMKINLRALLEMFETRLCLRVQGEHRKANIMMAQEAKLVHPWLDGHIGSLCATKGICAFPRYDCPISKAVPELKGLAPDKFAVVKSMFNSFGDIGLQPATQKEKS
jgi:thymidylate synthase (FAD)